MYDTIQYKFIAVIGRIPGSDEDTSYTFSDMTVEKAHRAFAGEIYRDTYSSEIEREEVRGQNICSEGGLGVYINHTLISDTEITVLQG